MSDQTSSRFSHRLLLSAVIVIAALLLWYARHVFLLIFLGTILSLLLRRTGAWISRRTGLSATWSITAVIFALVVIAAAGIWALSPKLISQVNSLADQIPSSWSALQQKLSHTELGGWLMRNFSSVQELTGGLQTFLRQAKSWFFSFFGFMAGIVVILVIGIYLAFGGDLIRKGIVKLVIPHKRERAHRILDALSATLYWWLLGRLASMTIIGTFTSLGLWALGVPLAFTLGIFAAVMTFIPNIGPIISVIPAVLLALQESLAQVGYVIILYSALQFVESYLLTPLIQRKAIAMPPTLILSAQLIMGIIAGVLGVLAATPLLAALIVLVKFLYIEEILGDREIEIQAESH